MPRPSRSAFRALLLALWAVALVLLLSGLDTLPLRDWDEAIVARVALETSRTPWPDKLLPTFWGSSYLNKPPGLHWLIAGCIQLWRILSGEATARPPEWVVRLVPALLSSLIVPLVGLLQKRLRPAAPGVALCSAAIALTLMPLARHGRLAMLDGTQLSAMALFWLGLLLADSRQRALAGGVIAGLAGSALLLLKAPVLLPVLGTGLLLRWLDRDLPASGWRWLGAGLLLGLLPGLGWHGWHLLQRGGDALLMWGGQGLSRLTTAVERHHGSPIDPLMEVLEGGWPWLPLWPFGLALAWRERQSQAGRWSLGLTLATAALVLPMQTQLPWYSLLLWPPFCLICGPALARLVGVRRPRGGLGRIPWFWTLLGGMLLLAVLLAPGLPIPPMLLRWRWLLLPAGLGLLVGGVLLSRPPPQRRRLGLMLLLAGWSLSLWLFFLSPFWNWELNEHGSVLPAAALAREAPEPAPGIYMEGEEGRRPSLRWYAEREILRLPDDPGDVLPRDFRLLRRRGQVEPEGGATAHDRNPELATLPRILRLQHATCRLEARGEDGWQRWRCITPGPHADTAP